MPDLNIVESFADGQVLFESDLDNICNSLTDFFNLIGIDSSNLQTAVLAKLIQTGTVVMYGSLTPPPGWLNCDGAEVSRAAFATLYGVVRDTFGSGDASTTFNLPDFQRRIPIGQGGVSVSGPANTIGSTGGEEKHQLTTAEMPAHTHTQTADHSHVMRGLTGSGSSTGAFINTYAPNQVASGITDTAISTLDNTGSDTAHNNVQPSLVVNFIIKT